MSSVGFIRKVGDSADCRELLKDIERVVQDDDDAGSAEAHDNVAGSAKFTLKKDGAELEDEEYCTPYAGPQSVEHQALHLPRVRGCFGRRSSWRRAKRGGVVACGVVAGSGELPGSSSVGDGHACLPRALPVREINDDPAVSSDGGLLAQRARRRCVACVETLVQQARALLMSGTHGRVFLVLCCASDSELAAAVVEHSVAIRVTSFENLQLTGTRPALYRLLRICTAYDVVVDIWVSIPCTAGTPFRRINEKLGAETGDLAMTYKLVDAAVGLCRHAVRIGGEFSWEWSNGNELWDLVVVRNLFARCGSSSCLVSTAAVGQHFVDREGGVFYVRVVEMFRKVMVHRGTLLRRHFFVLQGTEWIQNSAKGASCTSIPRIPSRTTTWQCAMKPPWCHLTITSLRTCSCQGPG